MTSPDTLPTYEQEADNNNELAFEKLNQAFPDLFEKDTLRILLQVQQGIRTIQNSTHKGQVIVHINPGNIGVEIRGSFYE
jgi:hypothetical protein